MSREFLFTAGSGISVTPTNNADGTVTWQITNTSPGSGGTLTASSVTGTGVWVTIGGTLQGAAFDFTGDVTSGTPSGGHIPMTLATVNANVGTFGNGTNVATFTVNGKGLITAASNTAITFPVTSVSGGSGISVTGSGALTVAIAAATAHSVMTTGAGSGGFSSVSPGSSGQVLTSNGAAAEPTMQTLQLPVAPGFASGSASVSNTAVTLATVSITTPADGFTRTITFTGSLNTVNTNPTTSWVETWGFSINSTSSYAFSDNIQVTGGAGTTGIPNATAALTFSTTQAANTTVTYRLLTNLSSGATGVTASGTLLVHVV